VLAGLSILGNTCLKTSGGGVDDENSAIGLRCTCDHVLDEITMPGSIDDSAIVLGSLKLPQRNIDCDTTLPLGLELIQHPCVLERALVHLSSLLLKALDHSLVDTPQLVNEMTSGSGLAGVDMSNDHDIDMRLLLSHLAEGLQAKPRHRKISNIVNNLQRKKMRTQQTQQESKSWCYFEIRMLANRDVTKKTASK